MAEPRIKSRLESKLFTTYQSPEVATRLKQCLDSDPRHITVPQKGDHVSAIQTALQLIRAKTMPSMPDLDVNGTYDIKTQRAVHFYKSQNAIQRTGQKLDSITGRMTITRLDDELRNIEIGGEVPPPRPRPGRFDFKPLTGEICIKSERIGVPLRTVIVGMPDDLGKADLLWSAPSTPEEKNKITLAAQLIGAKTVIGPFAVPNLSAGPPTAAECENALHSLIDRGGPNAADMADFFFRNTVPRMLREFPNGTFWSNQVRHDPDFNKGNEGLNHAIKQALQQLVDEHNGMVDPASLEQNENQPRALKLFTTNDIDFAATPQNRRFQRGDPLAFGFGSIQGVEAYLTDFAGDNQSGAYNGKLRYQLYDHFGSDPNDIKADRGQAGLFTLQRRSAVGQDMSRYMPYRVRIIVAEVKFEDELV